MKKGYFWKRPLFALAIVLGFCLTAGSAVAGDQGEKTVQTKEGIRFDLLADWPIKKQGSAIGPISVEEYVGRKFGEVEGRFKALEERVANLEKRLRLLEEEARKKETLQSVEGQRP